MFVRSCGTYRLVLGCLVGHREIPRVAILRKPHLTTGATFRTHYVMRRRSFSPPRSFILANVAASLRCRDLRSSRVTLKRLVQLCPELMRGL
jgi:hypothetical protein